MFDGLQEDQLQGALEALLFVTDEPVSALDLAEMLEVDVSKVEQALLALQQGFERDNRGIQLREVAGGWRLFTHPAFHELIERYVISWDTRKLSQAALETLAIVAYCQPVTRAGVSSIRGVSSDSSINSLVEKGLVREAGTADVPGNPMQYATTRVFLERFGLRSVADLPDVSQFAPDEETRQLICERLSATTNTGVSYTPAHEANDQERLERLSRMQLSLMDECEDASSDSADAAQKTVAPDALSAAFAASFGLVDKIDFGTLKLEDDDE